MTNIGPDILVTYARHDPNRHRLFIDGREVDNVMDYKVELREARGPIYQVSIQIMTNRLTISPDET